MSLFPQTSDLVWIIPKSDYMSLQIIDIPWSEQTTDCRISFTDNLRKAAMIRADNRLTELSRFENSHRKSLVATTWNHKKRAP